MGLEIGLRFCKLGIQVLLNSIDTTLHCGQLILQSLDFPFQFRDALYEHLAIGQATGVELLLGLEDDGLEVRGLGRELIVLAAELFVLEDEEDYGQEADNESGVQNYLEGLDILSILPTILSHVTRKELLGAVEILDGS